MSASVPQDRHRVAIVVLEHTLVLDLAVAVQAFGPRPTVFRNIRPTETESPYEISVCGRAPLDRLTMGFTMGALSDDSVIANADTVVVPGLDQPWDSYDPAILDAIAQAAVRGARMVSLCAGAFVLASAGVLDGHRVTTHWALADALRKRCPTADVREQELYIDDGSVLSSGGMLAGADLCLHILRMDHGRAYANDVSRLLVTPPHRAGGQLQYVRRRAEPVSGALDELITWMHAHLRDDLSVERLAARAHLSVRTLTRRFSDQTGEAPAAWVTARRVELAREMLESSDRTVTEVAYASGFGSLAAFRRQFTEHTGISPRGYRSTFRETNE